MKYVLMGVVALLLFVALKQAAAGDYLSASIIAALTAWGCYMHKKDVGRTRTTSRQYPH